MFNLGLKCVCESLCMLVSSFLKCELQCCGRIEHTHRETRLCNHTDWLTQKTNGDSLEAEIVQLAQISGTDVMNAR